MPCPHSAPTRLLGRDRLPFLYRGSRRYESGEQRSEEQGQIALFWAERPRTDSDAAGTLGLDRRAGFEEEHASLSIAAETYATDINGDKADSFITCWYFQICLQPGASITYIQQVPLRQLEHLQRSRTRSPLHHFPVHPQAFGPVSAAATVLTSLFGENYAFTDHTHGARWAGTSFVPSFVAAAEEEARDLAACMAVLHYRSANK